VIVALDHVQVAAPEGCEHAARAFYGDVLGLEEIEKPPLLAARGGAWFAVGDRQLHVGVAAQFAPAAQAHPALRVSSSAALERLVERLEASGASVGRPDTDEIPGTVRAFASDPWGNRLELVAATAARVFI
jgi:catechol 2,3-dioxygenase-like lactoylglutathione lyase family enzyme